MGCCVSRVQKFRTGYRRVQNQRQARRERLRHRQRARLGYQQVRLRHEFIHVRHVTEYFDRVRNFLPLEPRQKFFVLPRHDQNFQRRGNFIQLR